MKYYILIHIHINVSILPMYYAVFSVLKYIHFFYIVIINKPDKLIFKRQNENENKSVFYLRVLFDLLVLK